MSTALAEPPTAEETVSFLSRCPNQVLTRRASWPAFDSMGQRRVVTEDVWRAEQQAGNERLLREGKEPIAYDKAPWKIEFDHNRYETSDPTIIHWLRNHRWFEYNGSSGFRELGTLVPEQEPTEAEQLREIREALIERDTTRAEIALMVEKETHNRPTVLREAAAAVESIKELDAGAPGADPNRATPSTSSD